MSVAPGLLISVRSAEEACAALLGGADLIDVKEPARGSLGRADDETISAVLQTVGGVCPVSAALGELLVTTSCPIAGLAFAKWGLAGAATADWTAQFRAAIARRKQTDPECRPVVVAYADWTRAVAPSPNQVAPFAGQANAALLIDTCIKDGSTLLDWLPLAAVGRLVRNCRQAGTRIALAGSLGIREMRILAALQPDWLAVRSAACLDGRRDQRIDVGRVRQLAELLRAFRPARSAG